MPMIHVTLHMVDYRLSTKTRDYLGASPVTSVIDQYLGKPKGSSDYVFSPVVIALDVPESSSVEQVAEACFELSNHPARRQDYLSSIVSGDHRRSLSVGDCVQVGDEVVVCAPMGWIAHSPVAPSAPARPRHTS